jgi:hypothetical protein
MGIRGGWRYIDILYNREFMLWALGEGGAISGCVYPG